jgi:hypothetical protein
MDDLLQPPPPGREAQFTDDFGRRFLLTVDTEEEFDWDAPLTRERHSLLHIPRLARFQEFCENQRVVPVYLIDYPIAASQMAADILRPAIAAGKAEVGVQLHPWVSPPFDEELTSRNSFAGNLPARLEDQKLRRLRDLIEDRFGVSPAIYRAGRYGIGQNTADLLKDAGIQVDTSVRALFDYSAGGGPDFRRHPLAPYWADDAHRLLELPLTTVYWGMLRRQGDLLYPRMWRIPRLRGLLSRLGLLERIPLTPEGVTLDEAIRGLDMAMDDGLPLIVLSFHSPSLAPGYTPYVRSEDDLDRLYDWWRGIFAYCRRGNIENASLADILQAVKH